MRNNRREDFAELVRANEQKLSSELRTTFDYIGRRQELPDRSWLEVLRLKPRSSRWERGIVARNQASIGGKDIRPPSFPRLDCAFIGKAGC